MKFMKLTPEHIASIMISIMDKDEKTLAKELAKLSVESRIELAKRGGDIILSVLSNDESVRVREAVANNENTPIEVLNYLTKNNYEFIKNPQ